MAVSSAAGRLSFADGTGGADQKAAAQALFDRGRALVEQGEFAEACPELAESERLDPGIGTLLWLSDCYENLGRTASAWAGFKEAAAAAAVRHDDRVRIARERAAALEARLPRLVITVASDKQVTGLLVRRDGVEVGQVEWGLALPLDPGSHTVSAAAPDREPWSVTVDVPPSGGTVSVEVPVLGRAAPSQATAPNSRASALPSGARPLARPGEGQRVAGAVVAGLGLAGLAVGTVYSVKAKLAYDDATSSGHCLSNDECDSVGTSDRRSAYSQAAVATIVLSAGAVATAGGAVLYLTSPRSSVPTIALVPSRRGASARFEWAW
jgi:hypothetical protein